MKRQLCIVMHDVAPPTWPQCERLLSMVADIDAHAPITLLIVPDFHGHGAIDTEASFVEAIAKRVAHGDELALHGLRHIDDSSPPRTVRDWFRRRILTSTEGEFSALSADEAQRRLALGREAMSRIGWKPRGFVPPAWLASEEVRDVLARSSFSYTSTHRSLVDLRDGIRIDAPCITASSRSAWRRMVSRIWMHVAYRLTRRSKIVRVGLHPIDAEFPSIMRSWRSLLRELLSDRSAVTKIQAIAAERASRAEAVSARFDPAGETPTEI